VDRVEGESEPVGDAKLVEDILRSSPIRQLSGRFPMMRSHTSPALKSCCFWCRLQRNVPFDLALELERSWTEIAECKVVDAPLERKRVAARDDLPARSL
jgi:hypothetical protein